MTAATPRNEFLTAPTTNYAEIVLCSMPIGPDPVSGTIRVLSDPENYTHALDMRTFGEVEDA